MAQPDRRSDQLSRSPSESQQNAAGCLLRLYWMIFGYLIAVLCGVSIVNHHGDFSLVDIIYWLAILGILAARWVDIQRFGGTRADGQSATMRDWTIHAVATLVVAVIGWIVIHFVRLQGLW
ncbi:MAG: hypothetical protein ACUVQG_05225 [Thermogutta sp.]